jgi:hypothetical protein
LPDISSSAKRHFATFYAPPPAAPPAAAAPIYKPIFPALAVTPAAIIFPPAATPPVKRPPTAPTIVYIHTCLWLNS